MTESLAIEITRTSPGEWRVVERTHRTTESAFRVLFEPDELTALLQEIAVRLGDIGNGDDGANIRLAHLGSRLSEMTLPPLLRQRLAAQSGPVEFFLDDQSVILPVELFPNQGSALAENIPVIRHWFCESAGFGPTSCGKGPRQALIVADPAGNLPDARKEGELVQRRFGRRKEWKCSYLSRSVTAEQLEWDLPTADLLHLAAHYEAGTANEQSGVVMADRRWLPSSASPAPELVFANCCRAGLPSDVGGDLSLAGHFLKHGARHVVAPFLPVPDETALLFSSAFYTALDRNADVAEAVLSARKELGPAGWMYWHFGSTSREGVRGMPVHIAPKRRSFSKLLFILVLVLAAAAPWMKEVDNVPMSNSEPLITTEQPSSALIQPGDKAIGESSEAITPALEPVEPGGITSQETPAPIDETIVPATDVSPLSKAGGAPSETEPKLLIESKSVVVSSDPESTQPTTENTTPLDANESNVVEHSIIEVESTEPLLPVEEHIESVIPNKEAERSALGEISPELETTVPVVPASIEPSLVVDEPTQESETQPIGLSPAIDSNATVSIPDVTESEPEIPEPDVPVIVEQPQPVTEPQTVTPTKPGLFDDALAEVDRQQSFEEAAIQVLEGYPEKYLRAAISGKPDYNSATGKASIIVEISIDNAEYRAMTQRLSETLRKFGHEGEHISATMERPYDSYMEIRYQFSGRKRFRDLLFLCTRANDALTQSEWEFHSLPRSSIDAILSSLSVPFLTVQLADSSGQTIVSTSQKIPKPLLATEERAFSILPAFNGERSEMTMTSVIPGRNTLEVKVEFDFSLEELRQITDVNCSVVKGKLLSSEFQYRFLQRVQ